jgi:hypothetical protein
MAKKDITQRRKGNIAESDSAGRLGGWEAVRLWLLH